MNETNTTKEPNFFQKLHNYIDGNKSLIAAVLLLIVKSAYVVALFTDPTAYDLLLDLCWLLFGGGMSHKLVKQFKKKTPSV